MKRLLGLSVSSRTPSVAAGRQPSKRIVLERLRREWSGATKGFLALSLALATAGCTCNKSESTPPSARPVASSPPPPSSPPAAPFPEELRAPSSWPVPTGLRLGILAGKGVGPIRLGATVQTIERLMQIPCEFRTPDSCRYIGRAIEFLLKDGVTVEMHIHRRDRSTTPEGRVFGVFNGRTPEGVAFYMLPSATEELLGPPKKIEPVKEGNPWGMVEVRHYPGMRLEFDRIGNGKVVLGGIVITAPDAK